MLMLDVGLADALNPGHLLRCMKCDFMCDAMNVLKTQTSDSCVKDQYIPAAFSLSVNAARGVVV